MKLVWVNLYPIARIENTPAVDWIRQWIEAGYPGSVPFLDDHARAWKGGDCPLVVALPERRRILVFDGSAHQVSEPYARTARTSFKVARRDLLEQYGMAIGILAVKALAA